MSANKLQLKRGSTAQVNAYLPAVGEPVVDLNTMSLKVGDGVTPGGVALSLVASAVKLATARSINFTGDATASVTFDGTSNVSAPITLADTGVSASTYARVTVDSKGRVTNGAVTLPVSAGGTGSTTAPNALLALGAAPTASPSFTGVPIAPTAAVGTNTTQLATTALVQAEIANNRAWTTYTPTVTATSGTFTSVTATGKYMVAFGICFVQISLTITTAGTGTYPILTLPLPALAGSSGYPLLAKAAGVAATTGSSRITGTLTSTAPSRYDNTDWTTNGEIILISGSYPIA